MEANEYISIFTYSDYEKYLNITENHFNIMQSKMCQRTKE